MEELSCSALQYADGNFGGVITAMVTPMRVVAGKTPPYDVEFDYDSTRKLVRYLLNNGTDALVLSGTTGEAPATHLTEKGNLIRTVKYVLNSEFSDGNVPIIAGVGSNDTQHVIANINEALSAGADALLVVAPYYSRPSQAAMVKHFEIVLETAMKCNLPVILYDVPGRAGVEISADTYVALSSHPNFVAIKDATGNVENAKAKWQAVNSVRRAHNLPDIALYAGDDSLLPEFLDAGAKGIISVASHLVGSGFVQMIDEHKAGNSSAMKSVFDKCAWAVNLCNGRGQQAADTKAAMQAVGAINERVMRLPNLEVSDTEFGEISEVIKANITN